MINSLHSKFYKTGLRVKMGCPQTRNNTSFEAVIHNTFLHCTHQNTAQGLDASGAKTSVSYVCIHVTAHILNMSISMNFNQEYGNITLAIISILLYL
jgi:hypothetical protein